MDHKSAQAHDGLRKIRYWAARHDWQSGHDTDRHKTAQKANITAALKEWEKCFFASCGAELICLLMDAYDNAGGTWVEHPLLVVDDGKIREYLAKYFYLVQAFPNTIPSIKGFFFHKLSWPHGILSIRHGDAFDIRKDTNQSVTKQIGEQHFEETWITLPQISNSTFYDGLLVNYNSIVSVEGSLSNSPDYKCQGNGLLPQSKTLCQAVWGPHLENCKSFIRQLPNHQGLSLTLNDEDIEQGMWALANISWFLQAVSNDKRQYNYHYYFFRALPDKSDDFFHTSGQGLLSWASLTAVKGEAEDDAAKARQATALTACLTLSRLSDAALPFYQRRAVTQKAQSGLGQRRLLMWAVDKLVLPVMLGAQILRLHEQGSDLVFQTPDGKRQSISDVPEAFTDFVNTLWPVEPWRPQCLNRDQQLEYLLGLIEPLGAEEVPQIMIDTFNSIVHEIKRIPNGATKDMASYKRTITVAQSQLAMAGALFVPAQNALHEVHSKFEEWSAAPSGTPAVSSGRDALVSAISRFSEEFDRLGKLSSLNSLMLKWGEEEDGVIRTSPCGRTLASEPFPKISLPFYITDLDFAYKALRHNWKNGSVGTPAKDPPTAHFVCCVLPDNNFLISWREEPGWCDNFNKWKQEVWKSMKSGSARGLPFVLRFAAQNNAAFCWVHTKEDGRECLVGTKSDLDAILDTCCGGCLIKNALQSCYEIGMVFKIRPVTG